MQLISMTIKTKNKYDIIDKGRRSRTTQEQFQIAESQIESRPSRMITSCSVEEFALIMLMEVAFG